MADPYQKLTTGLIAIDTSLEANVPTHLVLFPNIYGERSENFNRTAIKKGPAVVLGDGAGIWDAFHILNLAPLYELLLAKALADKRSRLASKGYISRGQGITRGNSYYKAWQASCISRVSSRLTRRSRFSTGVR